MIERRGRIKEKRSLEEEEVQVEEERWGHGYEHLSPRFVAVRYGLGVLRGEDLGGVDDWNEGVGSEEENAEVVVVVVVGLGVGVGVVRVREGVGVGERRLNNG